MAEQETNEISIEEEVKEEETLEAEEQDQAGSAQEEPDAAEAAPEDAPEGEDPKPWAEKEKSAMFETGAKSVIEKILPIVDNFERGLAMVPQEKREDPFVSGMDHIYRQLLTELENLGVKPIEAVGKEFDPGFHNAVMQVESQEYESGTVAQELLKGYTYRESVVRHSMVAVVQ